MIDLNYGRIPANGMKVSVPTIIVLVFIAVCSGVLDWFTPMMGDDLSKWYKLGADSFTHPDRSTLSFILGHFTGSNGRILDMFGPVAAIWFPKTVTSIFMGLMAGLYFYSVIVATGANQDNRQTFVVVLLASTIALMPWWDYMWLRVCQFNYIWGTAFCVLAVTLFFRGRSNEELKNRLSIIGYFIVGFLGASSHEMHGIALVTGFIIWYVLNSGSSRLSHGRRWLLAGIVSGAVIPFLSPNFWNRSATSEPQFDPLQIILSTLPLVLVLLIATILTMLTKQGRKYVHSLSRTSWVVFFVMAITSGLVAIFSGVPGRTGWLAETCAIVAIAQMLLTIRLRIPRLSAALLSFFGVAFIALHYTVSISSQMRANSEYSAAIKELANSEDGIIFGDFTRRSDFPFLCLDRVKGVTDNDDMYLLSVLSRVYKGDSIPVCVLPEAFRGRLESISDSLRVDNTTIYLEKPAGVNEGCTFEDLPLYYINRDKSQMLVTPIETSAGRSLWVVEPLQIDKGDKPVY